MSVYIFIHNDKVHCEPINTIRGVNIGGWLVLEPWITPSMFYSFLGTQNKIGMDMYSFCDVLGPVEANRKLREHWDSWITEDHIRIFAKNNINLLRVPIGDWMFIPYGPFLKQENRVKCTDGSIDALDRLFHWASQYNIQVLLDLHGVKGSQNGFDNSGQSRKVTFQNNTFVHWEIREANWLGEFDQTTKSYTLIDNDSIQHSKHVLEKIIRKYSTYESLYGLCVLNEPWEYTPELFLKQFYQEVFDTFIEYMASDKVFVIHDSFRSTIWENFELQFNKKNITILIDSHQYTAWNAPYESFDKLIISCQGWQSPRANYKYVIGEWSLAIDNCEMWLNGFMDNVPYYPLFDCEYKMCPKYKDYPFELDQSTYGPFGTGVSYPLPNYQCPVSIPFVKHFQTLIPEYEMAKLVFQAKTKAFEKNSAGWIFWNFRTESDSYQWNLLAYLEMMDDTNNTDKPITYVTNTSHTYGINYATTGIIVASVLLLLNLVFIIVRINMMYKRNNYYQLINTGEERRINTETPTAYYTI